DDESPDVQLQVAIAAPKIPKVETIPVLLSVLANCGNDPVIPPVVWQNLHPLLESESRPFLRQAIEKKLLDKPAVAATIPRVVDRILALKKPDAESVALLFAALMDGGQTNQKAAEQCLNLLAERVQTRELTGDELQTLKNRLEPKLVAIVKGGMSRPLFMEAITLMTSWGQAEGIVLSQRIFSNGKYSDDQRTQVFRALVSSKQTSILRDVTEVLGDPKKNSMRLRESVLAELGRLDSPSVPNAVLYAYPKMETGLQPKAVELLTQRPSWSKQLLEAIGKEKLPASVLNVNQARQLVLQGDEELAKAVREHWGVVRTGRDPKREEFVGRMKKLVETT
ncbi:MAG: hypothetical protein KDA84_04765, partial [Planctomycetaceae bacterium]|nr:hypothetical protein [Planctomycetaceae bacterium]